MTWFLFCVLNSHSHGTIKGAGQDGRGITGEQCSIMLRRFFHTIRSQNELLRTHIDAELYQKLATSYELPDVTHSHFPLCYHLMDCVFCLRSHL
jgi:hypothetical protein